MIIDREEETDWESKIMETDITIGITGGIGSGKSVVSRILRCNGFIVYDCDTRARSLMEEDKQLKELLEEKLGSFIYHQDGKLNKNLLSQIIFNDKERRKLVNSIVHEAVRSDIKKKRKNTKGKFFIESAILATSGLDKYCDYIWLITSSERMRIKRIEKRDKLDLKQIEKRIHIQEEELDLLTKDKLIVIKNDYNNALLEQVLNKTDKNINNQTYKILC